MVKSVHGLRTEVGHKKEKMKASFGATHTKEGLKKGGVAERRGGSRGQIRVAPGTAVPL